MAKQTINIGTSVNKGDGDPLRTAFTKINENFNELYILTGGSAAQLTELAQDYAAAMFTAATHSGVTVSYDDINNKLSISTTFDGDYDNLTNKPALFSGSYTDLTNTPTIPSDVSDLTDTTNLIPNLGQFKISGNNLGTVDNPNTGGWGGYDINIDAGNGSDAGIFIPGLASQANGTSLIISNVGDPTSVVLVRGRGNVQISTNSGVNEKIWEFSDVGTLIFPDASVQSTAVDLSAVSQDIIPSANITYDIGSPTNRFRDIYLSTNTIYLGTNSVGIDASGQLVISESYQGGEGIGDIASVQWTTASELEIRTTDTSPFVAKFDSLKKGDTFELLTGSNGSFPADTIVTLTGAATKTLDGTGDYYDFVIPVDLPAGTNVYVYNFNLTKSPLTEVSQLTNDSGFLTTAVLNNGLDADIKGSVFGDDSTILVDGVSGVLRANVNVANTWTVTTGDKTWSFIYGDVSLGTNPIFEFPGSLQAVGSQTGIYAPADDLSGNWGMSIDAANSPYNVDIGEISGSNYWRFSGDGRLYLPSIGGGGGAILRSPLNESIGLSVYNDTGAGATYTLSVATTGPINIPTASTGLGRLQNPDGIEILTNSGATAKMWSFGTDGKLTVPGIIELSNGAQIFNTAGVDDSITIGATGTPGTITFNGSGFFNDDTFFHKAIQEKFSSLQDATGVVTHNCTNGHIFYHTSPDANWTVNLTNFSLITNYATAITIIISQGGTGYYPNALQIGGAAQTINWQGNTTPTPSSNRVDVVTFSIINSSGTYTVLGQLTGF